MAAIGVGFECKLIHVLQIPTLLQIPKHLIQMLEEEDYPETMLLQVLPD